MKLSDGVSALKFGSKADTLLQLKKHSLSCIIPQFEIISFEDWLRSSDAIVNSLSRCFHSLCVAVRSSAVCEDGLGFSNAGAFESFLNVNPSMEDELRQAIERVFASYPRKNPGDQVLVQRMVENTDASGVILTRYVDDGSPYYVLNYDDETGRTDSVTSGDGIHKTVLAYRNFNPDYCDSPRVRKMLSLAREIEEICGGMPLDIEFAMDREGRMFLLQVRRISTVGSWHPDTEHRVSRVMPYMESFVEQISARKKGLYGDHTILGNMPDWNPAELIGAVPSPLAASLLRKLITSYPWSVARTAMGYRRMPRTELMVLVGGHPFIDVRASFNSFLPHGIPDSIGEKLIDAWLKRLSSNPSLHDKVEFEIAQTVQDFNFEKTLSERYGDVLDSREKQIFTERMNVFTNKVLDTSPSGSLPAALSRVEALCSRQNAGYFSFATGSPVSLSSFISDLLEDCIEDGTIPFCIIARHAFIAETLLRSAMERGAIGKERLAAFKASFRTIMGELASDTVAVCRGRLDEGMFHQKYGHLRPGTFDIMSPCYRDRADLFDGCDIPAGHEPPEPFVLSIREKNDIEQLLRESNIRTIDAKTLLEYAKNAIQGREYSKFIFSRNLSEALEALAKWGEFFSMGREDLSYLRIEEVLDMCHIAHRSETTSLLMQKVDQARMDHAFAKVIKLSYLIRGARDIHIVPIHRSEPNFITHKRVEAHSKFLEPANLNPGSLKDFIICVENADPGFDWIFTKGIAGLITKYGGANSHMAIRCAELQLPAAIGCGEKLFERSKRARKIDLDCAAKTIRSLSGHE